MSKKRFIKLLMSHGEQIHRARAIAFLYNARNMPYKEAYSDYLVKIRMRPVFAQLVEAANKAGESIKAMAISLKKFTEVMKNANQRNN